MDGSDLVAQAGEQSLGDGVAGGGPVELEDADMPAVGRRQVGDADQRLGRRRVQAPQRAEGRREGMQARRHGGRLGVARRLTWFRGVEGMRRERSQLLSRAWRNDVGARVGFGRSSV